MKHKNFIRPGILIILICIIILSSCIGCNKTFKVENHLKETIVTIDNEEIPLSEMMYYIMIAEDAIEKQALIYSPDDPRSYWNIHTNGVFMSLLIKEQTLNQVVYFTILYSLAIVNKVSLNEDEILILNDAISSKYNDMNDYQRKITQLDLTKITNIMTETAIVQKYIQQTISELGISNDEFSIDSDYYQNILLQHTVQINTTLWDEITFGAVTIKR